MVMPTLYLVALVLGAILSNKRPFPASMAIMIMMWIVGIAVYASNDAAFSQQVGTTFILFGVGVGLGQLLRKMTSDSSTTG